MSFTLNDIIFAVWQGNKKLSVWLRPCTTLVFTKPKPKIAQCSYIEKEKKKGKKKIVLHGISSPLGTTKRSHINMNPPPEPI